MKYTDSTLSDNYKDKYRKLVSERFNFELLSKEEEKADPIEARKRLDEATELVKVVIQDGHLVLRHNIWFGFFRNLVGGTIISIFVCIVGILVGIFFVDGNKVLIFFLATLFFVYLGMFLFRKPILVYNGEAYAQKLFAEFMGSNSSCD